MGTSQWMGTQGGNFTNQGNDTFDPTKQYIGIRIQQGVPLLDRDWNELEDIRRYQEMLIRKWYLGDGTPDRDGLRITMSGLTDFSINKGRYQIDGFEVEVLPQGGMLPAESILYSQQKNPNEPQVAMPALTPLASTETERWDSVYIDLWISEVNGIKNSDLNDIETCLRHRLDYLIRVNPGKDVPSNRDKPYNHYSEIAKIHRHKSTDNKEMAEVVDRRRLQLAGLLSAEPSNKLHMRPGIGDEPLKICFDDPQGNTRWEIQANASAPDALVPPASFGIVRFEKDAAGNNVAKSTQSIYVDPLGNLHIGNWWLMHNNKDELEVRYKDKKNPAQTFNIPNP